MLFAFPAPVILRTFYFSTHHRNCLPVQHSPQQEEEAPRSRLLVISELLARDKKLEINVFTPGSGADFKLKNM